MSDEPNGGHGEPAPQERVEITPVARPIHGCVRPPGSKSITNRALILASLARGTSHLTGILRSEDTQVMIGALQALGIVMRSGSSSDELFIAGCAGAIPADRADLSVANSGTTMRFLTAVLALGKGTYRLSGNPRMHQRPIGDLIDALASLGIRIHSENLNGCPPVIIQAAGFSGGQVTVRGELSSQYLSGLMMAAPCADSTTELRVEGQLVSVPYVTMTRTMMEAFGATVEGCISPHATQLTIANRPYRARSYAVEPDATAASYFLAAAAITGGRVTVEGISADSMQGDIQFATLLEKMGCRVEFSGKATTLEGGPLRGIDATMTDISDTVQTLAAVALFADGPTTVRGIGHIRHKETDRISDLARELRKLGAAVDETADSITLHPGPLHGASIATYDDHRMAMSLALVGLKVRGVFIENPACTQKTYAGYFQDLKSLIG